jgi:hypothetical protein
MPMDLISFVLNTKPIGFASHFKEFFQLEYTAPSFAYGKYYRSVYTKLVGQDLTALLERPSVQVTLTREARLITSHCLGNNVNEWVEIPLVKTTEKMAGFLLGVLCVGPEGTCCLFSIDTRIKITSNSSNSEIFVRTRGGKYVLYDRHRCENYRSYPTALSSVSNLISFTYLISIRAFDS